ncbi:MAG: hypothetical protein INQ03_17915 [Candidatus Heimdallarchaeota archaeon]|nr:hypothetical protein [Candidatus Heimdallarchaeota archaeon]
MTVEEDFSTFVEDFKPKLQHLEKEVARLKNELQDEKNRSSDVTGRIEALEKSNGELMNQLESITLEKDKEIAEMKTSFDPIKEENDRLNKRMKGLENTIKVISEWVPSQKESIEVLVALASAPDEFHKIGEISKMSKIASVVLKNRIIPMLDEKGFIELDADSIKMKSME